MAIRNIRTFLGIAPREEAAQLSEVTYAKVAENVDLFSGICKPTRSDVVVESGHSGPYFTIFRDSIISGLDSPVQMFAGKNEALVFRQSGVWKKRIVNTTVDLGVSSPSKPTLKDISLPRPTGVLAELQINHPDGIYLERTDYVYHITYSRENGGKIVEGKAGEPIAMPEYTFDGAPLFYHVLYRPTDIPANATHWNIYRADNGRTPQLVKACSLFGAGDGYDFFTDNTPSTELTRYLGEIGNENNEKYDLSYVITFERNTEGHYDESGPSLPARISQNNIGSRITRPVSVPAGTETWNVYRISEGYNPTTDYELVARVPIAQSTYDDYLLNDYLGDVIKTSYTSTSGISIQAGPPPETFVGMAGPHNGMLIGWAGGSIYYSEPGMIDYWSYFYRIEAKGEVIACVPNGSGIVVITTLGVQLITGTQPLGMVIVDSVSGYGGTTKRTVAYGKAGIYFLSRAGIVQVVEGGATSLITEKTLGQDYFKDYDFDSATMEIVNERIYLSNDSGTIILDFSTGKIVTSTGIYIDLFMDRKNGRLLGLTPAGNVVHIEGGDTLNFMEYMTGDIVLGNPQDKRFNKFELFGEGELQVELYVDGEKVAERLLSMDTMRRFKTIKVPRKYTGRRINIYWNGTGTVREIQAEVEVAPIEVKTS